MCKKPRKNQDVRITDIRDPGGCYPNLDEIKENIPAVWEEIAMQPQFLTGIIGIAISEFIKFEDGFKERIIYVYPENLAQLVTSINK